MKDNKKSNSNNKAQNVEEIPLTMQIVSDFISNYGFEALINEIENYCSTQKPKIGVDYIKHSTIVAEKPAGFTANFKIVDNEGKILNQENRTVDLLQTNVDIVDYPNTLLGAVKQYGSISELIDNANAYIIAHSLLPQARKTRLQRYSLYAAGLLNEQDALYKNIELQFKTPKPRGSKVEKPLKVDKSKLNQDELNQLNALAAKLGLKLSD